MKHMKLQTNLQISPKKRKQQMKKSLLTKLMKQRIMQLKNMKLHMSMKKKIQQMSLKKKKLQMKILSSNVASVRSDAFRRWL